MVVKQSIHTLFIVTLPIILTDHFNLKCYPVNELSKDDAVLSLEMPNFTKSDTVIISKQNTELLSCDNKGCFHHYNFNLFNINFNNKTWFENYTLIITISKNGSWREKKNNNSAIGNWKFAFPKWDIQTFCKLQAYAIYDGPKCSQTCIQDYYNITCFLTKVYPEALCHFNLSHEVDNLTNIAYQNVDYDDKMYYNTSCTITLPNNVTHYISVSMYPNVTGKSDDKKYGKSATFKIDKCKPELEQANKKNGEDNKYTSFVVILTNIICFSVVIAIGITVCILHFRKTGGYDVEKKYLLSIGLNNADPYLHLVTEIENLDIYSVIDLVNPKCTSEIIDPFSKVKEINTQSRKVSGYKEINVKNLEQNLDNDFYVNFHNATGVKNSNGKDTNMQKKALTMPRETIHPIQLKRVVTNDTQYTLVYKDGKKMKTQDNKDIYSKVDIIKNPPTTSVTSTINNSPIRLNRVTFNNKEYTCVDKSQKDGTIRILEDNKKPTSVAHSSSPKWVKIKAKESQDRKKSCNINKLSKKIDTSKEILLNVVDSNDTEVDTINCSSIFAQYK